MIITTGTPTFQLVNGRLGEHEGLLIAMKIERHRTSPPQATFGMRVYGATGMGQSTLHGYQYGDSPAQSHAPMWSIEKVVCAIAGH